MAKAKILTALIEHLRLSMHGFEMSIRAGNASVKRAIEDDRNLTQNMVEKILIAYPQVNRQWLETGTGKMLLEKSKADELSGLSAAERIRLQKALGPSQDKGIRFVPIKSQAGYTLQYTEPLFIEQLERVFIPGMPYQGDKYRIFEIEGDSMEPTLAEGFYVIAELVEPQDYQNTAQYYIYVVVKENQILIKRLYRTKDGNYVLISDNEEYYPQQRLAKEDIKELWLVKRKMDWNMPPPKKFDISIEE